MPWGEPAVYREAFRRIEAPAIIVDPNLVVRDVSEGGLAFTGYAYDELVGESAAILAADERFYHEVAEALAEGHTWNGEFRVRTKDGREVIGRGTVTPVDLDGEARAYVGVFVDTTRQRQYQNAAEVLNRLLRHDLRNELNLIQGYVEQARHRIDDAEAEAYLEDAVEGIHANIARSKRARTLQELLERRYDEPDRAVRLDAVLADAIDDAREDHEAATFRADDLPAVSVLADDLLESVVGIVLDNAVVHNDREPVVEVEVEGREETVVVAISDNGPGIPPGQRDLIFGREEETPLHHGTGISLFFADTVIESYGGEIRVVGDDSRGATFEIELERA